MDVLGGRQWHWHIRRTRRKRLYHFQPPAHPHRIPRQWHRTGDLQEDRRTARGQDPGHAPSRWGHSLLLHLASSHPFRRTGLIMMATASEILLVDDNPAD